MKRLDLRNGVVLDNPYEVLSRIQDYSVENLKDLLNLLFRSFGVLDVEGGDLSVSIEDSGDDWTIRVSRGGAVFSEGPLFLPSEATIEVEPSAGYVNLVYEAHESEEVDLLPHGTGTAPVLVEMRPAVVFEEDPTTEGVVLAQISSSGEVTDERKQAILRADDEFEYRTIDPVLIQKIENVFEREGVDDELIDLLENELLGGRKVVTISQEQGKPFFLQASVEPALREKIRHVSNTGSAVYSEPKPAWRVAMDWNLYGVRAVRSSVSAETFEVFTRQSFDLTNLSSEEGPFYLRFDGQDYEVLSFSGSSEVTVEGPVDSSSLEDSEAALHSGGDEYFVEAQPVSTWARPSENSCDTSLFFGDLRPHAELQLSPGTWKLLVQSIGNAFRATASIIKEIPPFPAPAVIENVKITGEQLKPAFDEDNPVVGNPFDDVPTDEDGKPDITIADLERYVERVSAELRRIQEQELYISCDVVLPTRTRADVGGDEPIIIGYDAQIELLTVEGWRLKKKKRVWRTAQNIMKEISWLDLATDRFRGTVANITELTTLGGDPSILGSVPSLREDDLVFVQDDGSGDSSYWRYEPRFNLVSLGGGGADGLTIEEDDTEGAWIKVDLAKLSYTPPPFNILFDGLEGGGDYRITLRPITEQGVMGAEFQTTTDVLRDAYNAELGYNFHQAIQDIYKTYEVLLEQVDPAKLNERVSDAIRDLRRAIEQGIAYGNPPRVDAPFFINEDPGSVTFVGRNLGSVTAVSARYVNREGRTEVVDLDFRIRTAGTSSPSILVQNIPALSNLDPNSPAVLSLEFNGGARGTDFVKVRYRQTVPDVLGPTTARFALDAELTFDEFTYGSTFSRWVTTISGDLAGPLPRLWPGEGDSFSDPIPFDDFVAGVNEVGTFESGIEMARLDFQTENVETDNILDLRLSTAARGDEIGQAIFEGLEFYRDRDNFLDYARLSYEEGGFHVYIDRYLVRDWVGQQFTLEWIYYVGDPDQAGLDDCKDLIIRNRGRLSDPPSSPEWGDYYVDDADGPQVYRDDMWNDAVQLGFGRHNFVVSSNLSDDLQPRAKQVTLNFRAIRSQLNNQNTGAWSFNTFPGNMPLVARPNSMQSTFSTSREWDKLELSEIGNNKIREGESVVVFAPAGEYSSSTGRALAFSGWVDATPSRGTFNSAIETGSPDSGLAPPLDDQRGSLLTTGSANPRPYSGIIVNPNQENMHYNAYYSDIGALDASPAFNSSQVHTYPVTVLELIPSTPGSIFFRGSVRVPTEAFSSIRIIDDSDNEPYTNNRVQMQSIREGSRVLLCQAGEFSDNQVQQRHFVRANEEATSIDGTKYFFHCWIQYNRSVFRSFDSTGSVSRSTLSGTSSSIVLTNNPTMSVDLSPRTSEFVEDGGYTRRAVYEPLGSRGRFGVAALYVKESNIIT